MIRFFAAFAALMVFVGLVAFMLWFNDWGRSVPDDLQQLLWAFSFVVWPVLTYHAIQETLVIEDRTQLLCFLLGHKWQSLGGAYDACHRCLRMRIGELVLSQKWRGGF